MCQIAYSNGLLFYFIIFAFRLVSETPQTKITLGISNHDSAKVHFEANRSRLGHACAGLTRRHKGKSPVQFDLLLLMWF